LAAKWYGFDVFWVNGLSHPFEEIGEKPNFEGNSLTEVLAVIQSNRQYVIKPEKTIS